MLCAHRGYARAFPENTLASVRAALELGLRFVEIDVQLSADRVPLVYHDATLKRVSGLAGDLRKLPWSRLKRLDAHEPGRFGEIYAGEKIASLKALAELVSKFKETTLFVELKEESLKYFGRLEMLAQVHEALRPLGSRQAVLISFDEPVLALARRATKYRLGYVLRRRSQLKSKFYRDLRPEFVFSDIKKLPRSGRLKIKGVTQCLWEVPEPEAAAEALARGIDMVETFAVDAYL
jgi:glycerophosphoryl diester phosphodiesterase